jgi:hypothetical protein
MTDKKFAPIQIVGSSHSRKATLVFLYIVLFPFILNFFSSCYQFTVETLILIAIFLSAPGKFWLFVLGQSGYNLKTISNLIGGTKQIVGCQRTTNIKELANHLQINRHYHRVHWNFDEDLRRRLAHLRLVLAITIIHFLLLLERLKISFSIC